MNQLERLAAAIILKTVEDWQNPKNHSEIEEFLESDWFEELTEMLQLESRTIRTQLREGNFERLNIRAAYR